ncbi:olfactory receptor 2D3-like [Alligator sinensis]|uniref:Olfactory receptor 2D3-like n=1 Tax=Alligator sinensis TaxID=38654 RepID=A0A3Q0FY97_ALLSI|nr:olfactory receptor 2D3-like [Alligator sinensis]
MIGHCLGMENQTTVTEFILLGLSSNPQLQTLLFFVFLVIYLITLVANVVIMLVIRADSHLHTPMYFFLSHLSIVDMCYSSTVVPQMLVDLLARHKTISANACFTQIFFIFFSGTCEIFILSVMAYDRYAAICKPLHYAVTMNKKVCGKLVGGSWIIVVGLFYTTALFQYMKPSSISSALLDQVFSVQYSILTPMLNPIIYSLKNKEVKTALERIWGSLGGSSQLI